MPVSSKTILYLMHVDWKWIKQRPHFLAEGLNGQFDVVTICQSSRSKANLVANQGAMQGHLSLPNIPMQRFRFMRRLNRFLCRRAVKSAIGRLKPEFVWLTHPALVDLLPAKLQCRLVYDCMDDALGFKLTGDIDSAKMLDFEQQLIKRSHQVFVSSSHLAEVIAAREACADKITLVRNAFDGKIMADGITEGTSLGTDEFRICYFGTVAHWFDFEAILRCLDMLPNVTLTVVGPVLNVAVPSHERIRMVGPVEHSALDHYAQESDCLIMPFKIDQLLLSVDPVKLYEYVNYGKPIISVYYDEIRRFEPFVSFYNTADELVAAVKEVMAQRTSKYSDAERIEFLQANSWRERVRVIEEQLGKMLQ